MTNEGMQVLRANEYLDPNGSIVLSGRLLGDAALRALASSPSVRVSLAGLRGLPSTYFNEFLRIVAEGLGRGHLARVVFDFDSPVQRQVYERSLSAVRQNAA